MYKVVFSFNHERFEDVKTFEDKEKARVFCKESLSNYKIDYGVFVEYTIYKNDKMIENFYKKKLDNYERV